MGKMTREFVELLDECSIPFNTNSLCNKAKDIIISYSFHHDNIYDYYDYLQELDKISSPIEQIFYVSYILYCGLLDNCMIDDISFNVLLFENIKSQERVEFDNKCYNIDFVVDFSNKNNKAEYITPTIKNLKYAIELDGFDYHSNKKQMNYDYERENNLKLKGYSVIRFTGSQLYKEPFKCVDNLIRIIVNDVNKEIEKKYE